MIEILVDKMVGVETVRSMLAEAFNIQVNTVAVVDDIGSLPGGVSLALVCERSVLAGEFPLLLVLHLYDSCLSDLEDEVRVAQNIAIRLAARCLVSDSRVNPYTMTMVTASSTKEVKLNVEKLDDQKEYWLD